MVGHRWVGVVDVMPEQSSEEVSTWEVTESITWKVNQSPLCSETPTIKPECSLDSERKLVNRGRHVVFKEMGS
jgi:hypothetical protein